MKFIVIEGLDGAGKSTQIKLLQNYFRKKGFNYKYLHFPRTDSPIFGELVARFLRGDLGNINEVNPYLVALIYAGDRENASIEINNWLNKKKYVLVDRYVYSNIAFQCAKITDKNEKPKLSNWINSLEYQYYKIPKPDVSIFLDVPLSFSKLKLGKERVGIDRDYLMGKKDIHEENMDFQNLVRDEYLNLINSESNFFKIDCSDENTNMLSPDAIFEKIVEVLTKNNIIQ